MITLRQVISDMRDRLANFDYNRIEAYMEGYAWAIERLDTELDYVEKLLPVARALVKAEKIQISQQAEADRRFREELTKPSQAPPE